MSNPAQFSRRSFLRDAGFLGASVMVAGRGLPARAASRAQTVAVFGGGIAGLTVAQELAERGFNVTVYERRAWGGKARSTEVPGSGIGGRKNLPGEHGWRTFLGFYQNLPDTMRRIPYGTNPNGAFDNVVDAPRTLAARDGGRQDFVLPLGTGDLTSFPPRQVIDFIAAIALEFRLPPEAAAHLANRMAVYLSSCDARRFGQWENVNWADFMAVERFGDDYRKVLVNTFSEIPQASKAERTSTQFGAHVFELLIYNLQKRGSHGDVFRVLNRPTNEAFIEPWLALLQALDVKLRLSYELVGLEVARGRITGARVRHGDQSSIARADWYVCALPVERARQLWTPAILAADPQLKGMHKLDTGWMNGLKFFLREERPISKGVVGYGDSPWQITSVSQAQFWPLDFASTYGDGQVRESFSAVISNWNEPGVLHDKPAKECTPEELVAEVWEQMKRHLNDTGESVLTEDLLHSWDIDPGMLLQDGHLVSDDPLVLPSVGQYNDRPDVTTAIPNLLLAGDYLKSDWEVANMETACFNGRRAANAILQKSGSNAPPAVTIKSYRPPEWESFKRIDELRWRLGQPNMFDRDLTLDQVRALLV